MTADATNLCWYGGWRGDSYGLRLGEADQVSGQVLRGELPEAKPVWLDAVLMLMLFSAG